MGQQQLLLLVLGIVIVGLAVVVGIQAFSENQKKANADALVNDAIRIASDAQAWKLKPKAFGGGGDLAQGDFTGLTFALMGYKTNAGGEYENLNGTFALAATATEVTITATSVQNENQVTVEVADTTPESITTSVDTAYAP